MPRGTLRESATASRREEACLLNLFLCCCTVTYFFSCTDVLGPSLHPFCVIFHTCTEQDMVFEWNIFPGFNTLLLSQEVQELLFRLDETPEFHRKNNLHVDVQRHLMEIMRQCKRMRVKCLTRFSVCKKILEQDNYGLFLVLFQRKSGFSISENSPQDEWDKLAELMMFIELLRADIQLSVPRVHCPEVSSKAKAVENCRSTILPTRKRSQLFFSHNYFCKSVQSLRSSHRNV